MDAPSREYKKRGLFAGVPVIIGCVLLVGVVGWGLLSQSHIDAIHRCREMMANIDALEWVSGVEPTFGQTNGQVVSIYHSTENASTIEQLITGAYGRQLRERIEQGGPSAINGVAPAASFSTQPDPNGGTEVQVLCP